MKGIYMKKSGRIINFDNDKVYIITKEKEFVTLERNDIKPVKGNIYEGKEYIDKSNAIKWLCIIIAISLVSIGCIYFIFFSSKAKIVVNVSENIKIGINDNKVVAMTDINGSNYSQDSFPAIKGTDLNDGLCLLLDYALKTERLPQCDLYSPGQIYVYITKNSKKEPLNFDKFKEYAEKFNYNVVVNRNDNILNFD